MRMLDQKRLKTYIDEHSREDIRSGRVGGMAVSVWQQGKPVYQGCFGDERLGIQVDENTLFRIASMTKPVTTVAVLKLVEAGKLTLETPVCQYLPEYEHMNVGQMEDGVLKILGPAKTPITIRHLLTHTSGLGSGPVGQWVAELLPRPERKTLAQTTAHYAKYPLDFEPYTQQFYSGSHAFDVLARIVEILSGQHYGEFLRKEIFEPLSMQDTGFAPTDEQWERMTPVHDYQDGKGILADYPTGGVFLGIPTSCCAGGTALASTLKDYTRFAQMLLNYGQLDGVRIVGEDMIREMARQQLPKTLMSGVRNWGLGVRVVTDDPQNLLPCGCFGWSGALGSHFWVDPVNQIVAVYLKNSLHDGGSWSRTGQQLEQDVYASLEA